MKSTVELLLRMTYLGVVAWGKPSIDQHCLKQLNASLRTPAGHNRDNRNIRAPVSCGCCTIASADVGNNARCSSPLVPLSSFTGYEYLPMTEYPTN